MNKLIPLLVFATISIPVYAQDSAVPIKIDFKNKSIIQPTKKELRNAKSVYLDIDNFSPGTYKISVNKKDSFISAGTAPSLFSILSFGDGFNSLLSGLTAYSVKNIGNFKAADIAGSPELLKGLAEVGLDFTLTQPTVSPSIVKNLKKLQDEMRDNILNFHFRFRNSVIKAADALNAGITISTNPMADSARFRTSYLDIINSRLKLEEEIENRYNVYYDAILDEPQYDEIAKASYLRAADSMLTSYKKGFNTFLNKFDSTFNEAIMVKAYKEITKPNPPQLFKSFPYALRGDITTLDIEITPIDATKTPQGYTTSIELQKRPQEFWAFSTGVYMGGLYNKEYSILTNTRINNTNPDKIDTLNYSIVENGAENKLSVGINALLHFGWYFGNSNVGASVSFGPGLSLENSPKPRVMLGAGVVFGRSNKLMLSGGWMGGTVKRLATAYDTETVYNPAPTNITTDNFKGSWFISLGYAIFGK